MIVTYVCFVIYYIFSLLNNSHNLRNVCCMFVIIELFDVFLTSGNILLSYKFIITMTKMVNYFKLKEFASML